MQTDNNINTDQSQFLVSQLERMGKLEDVLKKELQGLDDENAKLVSEIKRDLPEINEELTTVEILQDKIEEEGQNQSEESKMNDLMNKLKNK